MGKFEYLDALFQRDQGVGVPYPEGGGGMSAIEVLTITGDEVVLYFREDAFKLNIKMNDAREKSGIFTARLIHGVKGKINVNLALFMSDARELTDDERVKFDV